MDKQKEYLVQHATRYQESSNLQEVTQTEYEMHCGIYKVLHLDTWAFDEGGRVKYAVCDTETLL